MDTGENSQTLRHTLDLIRFGSLLVLLIHFYSTCYPALIEWKFTARIVDRIIYNLNFLSGINKAKIISIGLLIISLIGAKGKKDEHLRVGPVLFYILTGTLLYFISSLFLFMAMEEKTIATLYISVTTLGYLSILSGGAKVSRLLHLKLRGDIFNDLNETFPQEERLIENEDSVNLPTRFNIKGKPRNGFINIISPYRSTIVCGTAGAGKSFYVVRNFITQMIRKKFTFFIYDFKFPDLTNIVYNTAIKYASSYPKPPRLYIINFDDLSRTHRCNAISPETMLDITDATESSRTIMLALNREWIKKQGDFFVESPINFVTALFWYLKQYEGGKYCTLPHAIELAQVDYAKLFQVLSLESQIEVLINPFCSAWLNGAMEQLEGQIASAKICLARLSSPSIYYVLSGNDFSLDLNNPESPKLICVGNNPSKQQTYGAVLSLYIERMIKQVNRKGRLKSSLIFDEFPTVYVSNISSLIATARSNFVSTTLCVQDLSQLRQDYGKEQADVIMNVAGNIISGQVLGDTAKVLSERIGKIMQDRESLSINSNDTSLSKSNQLESAIPPSKIANLSSGEFVGAVADTPTQRIKLKVFACEIQNDLAAIKKEESEYRELPPVREIDSDTVMQNYFQIKRDIKNIIDKEMDKINSHPDMKKLIPRKKNKESSNISL